MWLSGIGAYGCIWSCSFEAWKGLASWIGLPWKPDVDSPWGLASLDVSFDRDGVDYSCKTLGDEEMVGDMEVTWESIFFMGGWSIARHGYMIY